MDDTDIMVARSLLLREPEIFKHYLVDLNTTPSNKHEEAEKIFKVYNYPTNFEEFLEKYRKWCEDKKTKANHVTTEVSTTPLLEPLSQTIEEPPTRWNLEPVFSPRVSVIPPFRKRKRQREEFNVVEFLVEKKRNDGAMAITFSSDDDVQEELITSEVKEKKKSSLLADGLLRKIADQIELLNQTYNYRILDIRYE